MASATNSMIRRPKRLKWTERMNLDCLDCKRKAHIMISSKDPPLNENGRRKGYIKVMKELWEKRGYANLGLTSQNLRDHAARLEKTMGNMSGNINGDGDIRLEDTNASTKEGQEEIEAENQDIEALLTANANLTISNINLHETVEEFDDQYKDETRSYVNAQSETRENVIEEGASTRLPEYNTVDTPATIEWGKYEDGAPIRIQTSSITTAYNEIISWRKNVFLVPYGKIGRDFIDQLAMLINQWNNKSEKQHIALKAVFVLLAVGLQKPGQKSKAKDHKECLIKRLALWKDGEIDKLLREGRMIQTRIGKGKKSEPQNRAKIFAKLVMEGQINSAMRFLSDDVCRGVLPLTDDVMLQLRQKHPEAQEAKIGTLLHGPLQETPESLYIGINGEMIREAALKTKGSGGPSGIDANGSKRILACKSFKQSSTALCEALATLTKTLCTEFIDPSSIEAMVASRLIPLDKGEGSVRPIGVGEVLRRIISKCVMKVVKPDVIEASGSLQVCAGQFSGSEAAVHAMRSIFDADDTDAILLVDASNAFNALNRAAALHNTEVLCPTIATYAINTYRLPSRLFIVGGQELESSEGMTQGDPLSMALYAISLQPLITHLHLVSSTKQCWFADDASGAGSTMQLKTWWDTLAEIGPDYGYYPKDEKCWLIVKPEKEEIAKETFKGTAINITTQGQKHLGAVVGSRSYLTEYVDEKVEGWIKEVTKLAEFTTTQPQASYAIYTFGLKHRWTYFLRTLPDIQDLLQPLENAITKVFLPALTEHDCTPLEREILALPVRKGGLGVTNPCQQADLEYAASTKVTAPLVEQIQLQAHELPDESRIQKLKQMVRKEKNDAINEKAEVINRSASQRVKRMLEFASEKGASTWLTVIPMLEMGFNLNKREFKDGLKLRYDWPFKDNPSKCVCGESFNTDHAMICRRGGFIIQRHNELRDLEAELLNIVCNDVQIEPVLQEINGEALNSGSNKSPDARLDVHARGFWERQRSAFFDVRVCHPNAESYRDLTPKQIYRTHENEKKRMYTRRVTDIEQGTFTPLIFTTTGGMGEECQRYHSRLAELLANKKGERYSKTMAWIRAKISFSILRSALLCLRGSRVIRRVHCNAKDIDLDIETAAARIH